MPTPALTTPAPGPRTAEGRAVAARSALADPEGATTHGLFARDVGLPALGEDPAAFDALLRQLCEQLPPRNRLERHYLEQIAAASWRLRRLHRWQAQIYEDPAVTEDERMRRLDSVLRHETALTRQIDRAIRTLGRDLSWLFQGRARDEALYQRDLTEAETREDSELGIQVQRIAWRQMRACSPDAPLDYARLDNTHTPPSPDEAPDAAPRDSETQICQNEPTAVTGSPLPFLREAFPQEREGPGVGASLAPGVRATPAPHTQICRNEPPPQQSLSQKAQPHSHKPFSPSEGERCRRRIGGHPAPPGTLGHDRRLRRPEPQCARAPRLRQPRPGLPAAPGDGRP